MAKYIDADLLRKEIESRMGDCDANSKNPNQLLWAELAALIPFIDSLQREQPDTEKLKREWWNKGYFEGRKNAHIPAKELGLPKAWDFQQKQPCETCTNDKGCVTCKDGELWEGKEQPMGIHDIGVEGENGVNASDLPECQNVFKVLSKPMQVIRKCEETEKSALKKFEEVDLEKEIEEWVHNPMLELTEKQLKSEESISTSIDEIEDTARHFYNLGRQSKEPISEDLEEAASSFAWKKEQPLADGERLSYTFKPRIEAFKAGAKWQKAKMPMPEDTVIFQKGIEEGKRLMMEEAVEGEAHPDDCEIWVNLVGYGYDIKDGDKVRIIIVKED